MSGAQSISARRAYGVHRVCRVWGRARSSVYVRRHATRSRASRRRGPVGAATDEVLVGHIAGCSTPHRFRAKGTGTRGRSCGSRGSAPRRKRVRRLMREHGLQAPYRAGHAHGPTAQDGTITTAAPDVMWGTDRTSTVTVGEGAACVFVAVDHCTTECIGLHAAKRGTRCEALEPIRHGVRDRVGPLGAGVARGLRLRHDHGSHYLADDFQQEGAFFGIESAPSFVREPEGKGVAERFIRTVKENLCGCGASTRSRNSASPCSSFNGHTTTVAAGEVQLSESSPSATRFRRTGRGSVEVLTFKPLSKNPGALQGDPILPSDAPIPKIQRRHDDHVQQRRGHQPRTESRWPSASRSRCRPFRLREPAESARALPPCRHEDRDETLASPPFNRFTEIGDAFLLDQVMNVRDEHDAVAGRDANSVMKPIIDATLRTPPGQEHARHTADQRQRQGSA